MLCLVVEAFIKPCGSCLGWWLCCCGLLFACIANCSAEGKWTDAHFSGALVGDAADNDGLPVANGGPLLRSLLLN